MLLLKLIPEFSTAKARCLNRALDAACVTLSLHYSNMIGVSLKFSSYSSLIRCTVNIFVVNLQDTKEVPWFVLLVACI